MIESTKKSPIYQFFKISHHSNVKTKISWSFMKSFSCPYSITWDSIFTYQKHFTSIMSPKRKKNSSNDVRFLKILNLLF